MDKLNFTEIKNFCSAKYQEMPYLRYRNGCVLLGKYAAYTVSMAFLKEADSTRRSRK